MGKKMVLLVCFMLYAHTSVFAKDTAEYSAASNQQPATTLSDLNYLKDLEVFSNNSEVRVVIDFTKPLEQHLQPSFYEKSFQLDLPETYINPSKREFVVGDSLVSTVYAVQYSPRNVRLRFMFGQDAAVDQEHLFIEKKLGQIVLSIKRIVGHQENLAKEQNPTVANVLMDDTIDLSEQIREKVNQLKEKEYSERGLFQDRGMENAQAKGQQEPMTGRGSDTELKEDFSSTVPDIYSSSVKMLSALFFLLSVIFLLSYLVKRYFSSGEGGIGKNKIIQVLATSYIGPKKTIALVDVADEVLVLGISPNHISMLTKLEDKEVVERLKGKTSAKQLKGISPFSDCLDKITSFTKGVSGGTSGENDEKEDSIVHVREMIQERMNA